MHHSSAPVRLALAISLCAALAGCGPGGTPAASETFVAATVEAAVVATNAAATAVAGSVGPP
ncbi:MAG: MFS transporter, partial [Anaerolineae bacterium]